MREVSRFQTSDGELHATQAHAAKHADRRYGDALSKVVYAVLEIAQDGPKRYTRLHDWIDQHHDQLAVLRDLKNDLQLERCPNCKGCGEVAGGSPGHTCETCSGRGW